MLKILVDFRYRRMLSAGMASVSSSSKNLCSCGYSSQTICAIFCTNCCLRGLPLMHLPLRFRCKKHCFSRRSRRLSLQSLKRTVVYNLALWRNMEQNSGAALSRRQALSDPRLFFLIPKIKTMPFKSIQSPNLSVLLRSVQKTRS